MLLYHLNYQTAVQPKHTKWLGEERGRRGGKVGGDEEDWEASFGVEDRSAVDPLLIQLMEQARILTIATEEAEQVASTLHPEEGAIGDIERLYLGEHWRRFWNLLMQLFSALRPHDANYQAAAHAYVKIFDGMAIHSRMLSSARWYRRLYDDSVTFLDELLAVSMALDGMLKTEQTPESLILSFDPSRTYSDGIGSHLFRLQELLDPEIYVPMLDAKIQRFLEDERKKRGQRVSRYPRT